MSLKSSIACVLSFLILRQSIAAQPGGPDTMQKIVADWGKRRERISQIRYVMKGTRLWPRGAFNTAPNLNPSSSQQNNPSQNVTAPVTRKLLLDFAGNRHRVEWDHPEYDSLSTHRVYRIRCAEMCDGEVFYSSIAENSDPNLGKDRVKKHVDVLIERGLIPAGVFNFCLLTLFPAHGLLIYNDIQVRPAALQPALRPADFTYHGQAVHGGRPCAIVRPPPGVYGQYEFWVDVERDSAVVKQIVNPDRPLSTIELTYRNTAKGWLPKAWSYSEYDRESLRFSERVDVAEIDLSPRFSDEDFKLPLVPGMYVEDQTYYIDPETKEYKSKSLYYRVEEQNRKTPLTDQLVPAQRSKWYLWLGLLLPLLLLVMFRRVAGRRRKQQGDG